MIDQVNDFVLAYALLQSGGRPVKKAREVAGSSDLPLLEWTLLQRRYVRPGVPFTLSDHLYLVDLYRCAAQEAVFMKAGQIGVSELLVSYALHATSERGADVLYLMPTDEDVSDFSQARFATALESSAYLESLAQEVKDKRMVDRVKIKRFRDALLYLRGGGVRKDGSARQLKSVPADVLIMDELDEMDTRTEAIARKRLGHSMLKEVRLASTPTYHGVGVHNHFMASDQREWFVPCPACGKKQQLLFTNCVTEFDDLGRPARWHGQDEGSAWIACVKCGAKMNRLAAGEWVAAYPGRPLAGFHPTKLMTAQTPLLSIIKGFQNVDETSQKEATNQDLGLPYTPRGGQLTDDHLRKLMRDYRFGPVPESKPVMGVDVGGVLHVIIRAQPDSTSSERRLLFAGTVGNFSDLTLLAAYYKVETIVIDALPETRSARDFQALMPDKMVFLCYYGDEVKRSQPVEWKWKDGFVHVDRSWTLDITTGRFFDGATNTLPAHIFEVRDYASQLKNLIRTTEVRQKDGNEVVRYIQGGPDHYGHAENYATIAGMRKLGWARG